MARFPVAGGGETCQPDATVSEGRMMAVGGNESAPGLSGVAGVVPDGVNTVTITPSNGPAQTVPVHDNVYMAELGGGFSVSFTGPDGPVTVGEYQPPTSAGTVAAP
ncbi:MAG: hypothetical protein ABSD82_04810 [Solirubrobacteraceae bacterium]